MTHPGTQDRLDDYVDGLLSAEDRREVEGHLAACETCRREVESLRALLAHVRTLPGEIAPAPDPWPEIAARIARQKVLAADFGPRWSIRRLAAAALLLVALSSTITALLLQRRWIVPAASVSHSPRTTAFAAFEASEEDYVRAIAQLTHAVDRQRHRLDPKTIAIVEENLHIIDEAIRESRAALAADPNSVDCVFAVTQVYESKIDLLRQALELSSGI